MERGKKYQTINLKMLKITSEESLNQIGRRSTKGSSPKKEKARKYMCMWAFKINCSVDKHQVSLTCFISCTNERIYFV